MPGNSGIGHARSSRDPARSASVVAGRILQRKLAPVLSRLSFFALLVPLFGCAAVPPGPRGPLLGNGVQAATDFALGVSSARATREDGFTARGTSDHYFAPTAIIPQRLELRLSPVEWLDFGADTSWLDGGADARVGYAAKPSRTWAGHLAFGFRAGLFGEVENTLNSGAVWFRVEAYRLLLPPTGRLMLALGLDSGKFYHQINIDEHGPGDPKDEPAAIEVMRREVRLETAVGYFVQQHRGSMLLAIEPYFVVDSSPVRASSCGPCERVDYEQAFGVMLVGRFALHIPFRERD
jgi:hypothetical protein